jgi:predicted site-specific integrase-resolvase
MMGINPLTLRNWTRLGKIPKPVRIGATSLFEKEVFDRFLKEGGTPS